MSIITKLFEPCKIGKLSIKNRIVMAPMGIYGLVEPDGRISERGIDYYAERARGGVGLIITGATKVEHDIEPLIDSYSAFPRADLSIFIPRLNELVEAVHDYGSRIAIQLTAGDGRTAWSVDIPSGMQPVAPSPLPYFWNPEILTRELTTEEVETMVKAFGNAAEIVATAGFDAVELHAHEGYLFDEFMTSIWNKRTDKYGGDLNGRLRFPLEVIEQIKDRAGKDFPIIYRYGIDHYLEGGRGVGESQKIALHLEKAGVDAIHADAGCYETWYWPHPPIYQPPGCMVKMAHAVKEAVRVPVIAVGKLGYPELAEKVLQEGKADFIALGRALLADPEWPIKVKEGRLDDIRPCIGDHEGCLCRIIENKYLSCTVNPAAGNERKFVIMPTDKTKSVLVVGGGCAGMEAARIAALRGHKVTLCEKNDELGGNLIAASVPEFKKDLERFRDYLSTQLRKLGVKILLQTEVTKETIEEMKPEAVIIATGSKPCIPDIPGVEKGTVITALDSLLGIKETGETVTVAGGGLVGCETAAYLAQRGKKVTIVEMLRDVACDLSLPARAYLLRMLAERGVNVLTEVRILQITNGGAVIVDKHGKKRLLKADTVVLALGMKPRTELFEALKTGVQELHHVGDCVEPGKIIHAIWGAFRTARLL